MTASKSPETRQRRNRTTTSATLEAPPVTRAALYDANWHAMTQRWWTAIWDSPMADEWVDADVPGLMTLARLVDDFWRAEGSQEAAKLAGEIRMQQREYGLSPLSRRSLQWEIKRLEATKPPPPRTAPRRVRGVFSVLGGGKSAAG